MTSQLITKKFTTIEPSGYLSAANSQEFQAQLTQIVTTQESTPILVDMAKVEFIDSAALMSLISAFRLAQTVGRRFGVCCLAPSVRMIFELTQLDRAFEIFENPEAFAQALN